ncbi:MAG TPA: hypothetical protein VMU25_03440 [Candidatus Paceibacterota bacterium]|nr:hypothetical protein [Candidatus Paceibacterota bacterium]
MSIIRRAFLAWLPLCVTITAVCGLVYAAVQQNYRQSLNDPQIQMAEDAAAAIVSGKQIDQVVPTTVVDIRTSLSPWMAVYTNAGVPLLSSGKLDGELPRLPSGVFDTSTWKQYAAYGFGLSIPTNETRFTWQPRPDVRQAVVVVHFDSQNGVGYVAVGRNMREVEARSGALAYMVFAAWLVAILASYIAQLGAAYLRVS